MRIVICDLCGQNTFSPKLMRGRKRRSKTLSLWGFGTGSDKDIDVCQVCAKGTGLTRSKLIKLLKKEGARSETVV